MKPAIKMLLTAAKKNPEFVDLMNSEGTEAPGIFADNLLKHAYALTYYGFLVGRYGTGWKRHI